MYYGKMKSMLDIRFIRENAERVQTAATQKGYQVSIAQLLELDDSRRTLQRQVDELRQKRNEIAAKMKNGQPEQTLIDQGKQIKTELVELEEHLKKVDTECIASIKTVPNVTADDVPLGGEADSGRACDIGGVADDAQSCGYAGEIIRYVLPRLCKSEWEHRPDAKTRDRQTDDDQWD